MAFFVCPRKPQANRLTQILQSGPNTSGSGIFKKQCWNPGLLLGLANSHGKKNFSVRYFKNSFDIRQYNFKGFFSTSPSILW